MAKEDDRYKEGRDFEWANSNARTKDGGYVKTRRFFTKAEKADRASPKKAAPASSSSSSSSAPAKAKPVAGGARPTVGAAGGMPAAKPKPAGGARPTVGAAGSMPAAKPKPARAAQFEPTTRPTQGPKQGPRAGTSGATQGNMSNKTIKIKAAKEELNLVRRRSRLKPVRSLRERNG